MGWRIRSLDVEIQFGSSIASAGKRDVLLNQEGLNLYDSNDKELNVFHEGFHELHNDVEKEKLKATITQWMHKRLKSNHLKNFGN